MSEDIKKQIETLAGSYSRHMGNACDNLAQYHDGELPDEIYNNHFEEVMNLAIQKHSGWNKDVLQNVLEKYQALNNGE